MDPSTAATGDPDRGPPGGRRAAGSPATAKKKTVGNVLVGELQTLKNSFFSTLRETKVGTVSPSPRLPVSPSPLTKTAAGDTMPTDQNGR